MKKNGYTIIELLVLILFLGIVTAFVITKESHAFTNNTESIQDNKNEDKKSLIEFAAKKYAREKKELFVEKNSIQISVEELIVNNYLTNEYEEYKDTKITIIYEKENDDFKVEIVK